MKSAFLITVFLALFWSLLALGVLLPLFGIAWVIATLTDLSLAQACLVTFGHSFILVYLFQSYLPIDSLLAWILTVWFACLTLAVVMLGAHIVHRFLDLSLFQAAIAVSGSQMVVAYLFAHSVTGDIPAPFRRWLLEEWYEYDEPSPPPRKSRRKRKK
ncbi:MAG TPA: hypothetical protein ENN99_01610 [Chloroflexi bacterium]|nr:hypothetical protein [Chloroflexota bacterium]